MISGVVLAAGLSRRMGAPKQMLPLNGETTLLGHALAVAARSRLGEVVVVLSPPVFEQLDLSVHPSVVPVLNRVPEQGQSHSLRLGLAAVSPEAVGALILLCDQPGVTTRLIDFLIAEFEREPCGALVPTYGGKRSTPVLLGRTFCSLVDTLSGDTGARRLLDAYPELVREIEAGHLGAPEDIDTPEQYERLVARSGAR